MAGTPFCKARSIDTFQLRQFFRSGGDDQLAANIERDTVFVAKGAQGLVPCLGHFGFQTAWLVVDTGMNDAAVAAGLMLGKAYFLFHQQNSSKGITTAESSAGRQPNNSSTNYCEIIHRLPFKASAREQGWICSQTETTSVDRPIFSRSALISGW